jgi:single-stranded-DNA-specific exonuclease
MKKLTYDDIYAILNDRNQYGEYKTLKDIPHPNCFKDIQKATTRIVRAIQNKETINIVGDYDVDGIVSMAIIIEFFNMLKIKTNYIIPNRFEHGYGLNSKILENIYNGLIITVDNGISAFEASKICKERKLDLIITDHHTVGDKLPEAYAIVNPKQNDCNFPFEDICGAQVTWYLCAMIKQELKTNINLMSFFDILTLAIIADIMPMKSLNFIMVKNGFKALANSTRPAIVALRNKFDLKMVNEDDISFKIAPLLNCAGRMDDAIYALDFLLSCNIFEANKILNYLINLNEKRKIEQNNIYEEAEKQINSQDNIIFVASSNWNEGIIGIIANKLNDNFKKPTFVFSIKDNIAKGSSRSNDINLYNLISLCSKYLINFGGHKNAAGMSLDISNLNNLKNELNYQIKHMQKYLICNHVTKQLGQLDIFSINDNLYDMIDSFRPFGLDNEIPYFSFMNMLVIDIRKIGKNKEYTKLIVTNQNTNIEVLIFTNSLQIKQNSYINFIASISKNKFKNKITYNLIFKELLP